MDRVAFQIAAKRAQLALDALQEAEGLDEIARTSTPARRRKAAQAARERRDDAARLVAKVRAFAL